MPKYDRIMPGRLNHLFDQLNLNINMLNESTESDEISRALSALGNAEGTLDRLKNELVVVKSKLNKLL